MINSNFLNIPPKPHNTLMSDVIDENNTVVIDKVKSDTPSEFHKLNMTYAVPKKVNFTTLDIMTGSTKIFISDDPDNPESFDYHPFAISSIQRYNPMYSVFFELSENNYDLVFFNHKYQMQTMKTVFDRKLNKTIEKNVFIKFSPLLDPIRYIVGKYNVDDERLRTLPKLNSTEDNCYKKYLSSMNSSYIDNFFCYLSSQLLNEHNMYNCIDYYGSFLGIQEKFKFNAEDDLEYLSNSGFFRSNVGKIMFIENYNDAFVNMHESISGSQYNKKSLIIIDDSKVDVDIDVNLNELHNNETHESERETGDICISESTIASSMSNDIDSTHLMSSRSMTFDDCDKVANVSIGQVRQASPESCSGPLVHPSGDWRLTTEINENDIPIIISDIDLDINALISASDNVTKIIINDNIRDSDDDDSDSDSDESMSASEESDKSISIRGDSEESDDDCSSYSTLCEEDTHIFIKDFPVQMICMEECTGTLDELFENDEIDEKESISAMFQVIMSLITFQKAFRMTHNDLHMNNIMFVNTPKKFIYYIYDGKRYKVPTFGRIFKIIDFGRAIYTFNGTVFCSDCFAQGGDAYGQYNCIPFLNDKKPVIEPNYSFDLCRLGCSIYDFLFDTECDNDEKRISTDMGEFKTLIGEWCKNDNGKNIIYRKNGRERYPGFKMYKMISRTKHNAVPSDQLNNPIFSRFEVSMELTIPKKETNIVINIDIIPICA